MAAVSLTDILISHTGLLLGGSAPIDKKFSCRLVRCIQHLHKFHIDCINIAMGGAVNFCLQKSIMPLAGLVYFTSRINNSALSFPS